MAYNESVNYPSLGTFPAGSIYSQSESALTTALTSGTGVALITYDNLSPGTYTVSAFIQVQATTANTAFVGLNMPIGNITNATVYETALFAFPSTLVNNAIVQIQFTEKVIVSSPVNSFTVFVDATFTAGSMQLVTWRVNLTSQGA